MSDRARAFVTALGGAPNLLVVDACTTRLRLTLKDSAGVDEAMLRQLGARGFVRPSASELQVILGPIADQVAGDMRASMRSGEPSTAESSMSPAALVQALGGAANIREVTTAATRLCFTISDAAAVDQRALDALPVRAIARLSPTRIHAIIGPDAPRALAALTPLLAR